MEFGCVRSILVLFDWRLWVDAVSLILVVVGRLTHKRYILPLVDDLRVRVQIRLRARLLIRSEFSIVRRLAFKFSSVWFPFVFGLHWFLGCSFRNKLRIVFGV